MMKLICLALTLLLNNHLGSLQQILVQPKSRLIPVGTETNFTCVIRNARDPFWVINSTEVTSTDHRNFYPRIGFFISHSQVILNGNTSFVLELRVVSSLSDVNNTRITCRDGADVSSSTALLFTLNDEPLCGNNVTFKQQNSSIILIQWTPPFIWPGYAIDYYNVSVMRDNDSSISFHRVLTSFNDVIVNFTLFPEDQRTCSEYTIGISAVTESTVLDQMYITGGYSISLINVSLSATTFFRNDRRPVLVRVEVEIPEFICRYQEMNYTLFIESGNGSLVLALHGPFQHLGSGILEHDITFHGLEEGGNYLLRIEVETNFENYTNYYPFDTAFKSLTSQVHNITHVTVVKADFDSFPYEVSTGVLSGILVITISVVLALVCVGFSCRWRTVKERQSSSHIHRSLIPNPIYDGSGPVYDSILQPTLENVARDTTKTLDLAGVGTGDIQPYCIPASPGESTESNTARYVDQSGNSLRLFGAQTSSMNDSQQATISTNSPELLEDEVNKMDDTYTLMNPAGTVTHSTSTGWDQKGEEN